jgi:hypothetical protein
MYCRVNIVSLNWGRGPKLEFEYLGKIVTPVELREKAKKGFLQPTLNLTQNSIEIYVGLRGSNGISHPYKLELSLKDPLKLIDYSRKSILNLGDTGSFDEHGIVPTCIQDFGKIQYLHYAGYQKSKSAPFLIFSGKAVSNNYGESWTKLSNVPYLDRNNSNTCFRVIHSIVNFEGKDFYFFGGGSTWVKIDNKMAPTYDIKVLIRNKNNAEEDIEKTAVSLNGLRRIGRPNIYKSASGFGMFLSIQGFTGQYKIAHTFSNNLLSWQTNLLPIKINNLPLSCSDMIAYPNILVGDTISYLFFNGNKMGLDGIHVATIASSDLMNNF